MLYKNLLNDWLKEKEVYAKYSTYTNYYNIVTNHIIPELGNYEIDIISDEIIQDYIMRKLENGRIDNKGGISQTFAKDIMTVIQTTLEKNIKIKLPYIPPKEVQIFEKPEIVMLINHLQENITPKNFGILLVLHTGIRIGELCALKWGDIHFETKLLKIQKTMIRTYTKKDGSVLRVTSPKSRSSNRTIPLDTWIMRYAVMLKTKDDDFILTNKDKPTEPNKYRLYYNCLLKRLNIPHKKFHSLRHTFATIWIECGCDYKSLSEVLGHSNVSTTMNLYVHPQLEVKRKSVEVISKYLVS